MSQRAALVDLLVPLVDAILSGSCRRVCSCQWGNFVSRSPVAVHLRWTDLSSRRLLVVWGSLHGLVATHGHHVIIRIVRGVHHLARSNWSHAAHLLLLLLLLLHDLNLVSIGVVVLMMRLSLSLCLSSLSSCSRGSQLLLVLRVFSHRGHVLLVLLRSHLRGMRHLRGMVSVVVDCRWLRRGLGKVSIL